MSSPRLNMVIACGGILASISCASYGIDYFLVIQSDEADSFCQLRPALLAVSFSLIYGPMVGKTWRVNQIFRLAGAKRVVIKDFQLLLMTAVLVVLDVVVVVAWHFLDSMHYVRLSMMEMIHTDSDFILTLADITTVTSCVSRWSLVWMSGFVLYKLPFLLAGLREAWWTRGLILPNINEAHCVVISGLVTGAIATIYLILSVIFRMWPAVVDACAVVGIWLSVVVAVCLVFFPKLLLWRRTPKGRVTRVSISSTSSSMAVLQSFEHLEAELTNANTEIETLRDFIKQKELDVEKLQNLLSNAETSLSHLHLDSDTILTSDPDSPQLGPSRSSGVTLDSCDIRFCCLHGNGINDQGTCLNLPPDTGYSADYLLNSEHSHLHLKRRRHTLADSISSYNSSISIGQNNLYGPPHHHVHCNHHFNELQHQQQQQPFDHGPLNYFSLPKDRVFGGPRSGQDRTLAVPLNKRFTDDDEDTFDDITSSKVSSYMDRLRKRRRSSTPSVHSIASLNKLSRLRTELSDAMNLSKQLRVSWSTDMEESSQSGHSKLKYKDRRRRRTAIGIREITDSIMESYDFQRTFDNQSFVSECITPRTNSEASYDSKSSERKVMKNRSHNNMRKIRQRRRESKEKVVSVSYTKNKEKITSISYSKNKQMSTGPDSFDTPEPQRRGSVIDQQVAMRRPSDDVRNIDSLGRISPAPCYLGDRDCGTISFIPAQQLNVVSLKSQVKLGYPAGTLAVITNDALYPIASESGATLKGEQQNMADTQNCTSSLNYGVKLGGKEDESNGSSVPWNFPWGHFDSILNSRCDNSKDFRQRNESINTNPSCNNAIVNPLNSAVDNRINGTFCEQPCRSESRMSQTSSVTCDQLQESGNSGRSGKEGLRVTFEVPTGSQSLEEQYTRDASVNTGAVRDLRFTPGKSNTTYLTKTDSPNILNPAGQTGVHPSLRSRAPNESSHSYALPNNFAPSNRDTKLMTFTRNEDRAKVHTMGGNRARSHYDTDCSSFNSKGDVYQGQDSTIVESRSGIQRSQHYFNHGFALRPPRLDVALPPSDQCLENIYQIQTLQGPRYALVLENTETNTPSDNGQNDSVA